METVTITLPGETYRLIKDRAQRTGKQPHQVLVELLEEALKKNPGVLTKTYALLKTSSQLQADSVP